MAELLAAESHAMSARGLRRMRPLLGTFVEIGIAQHLAADCANAAMNRAFAAIEQMQHLLSFQNPASELSRLNRAGAPLAVHPWTALALRLARAMTLASGGLFNCTLGGAMIRAGVLPNHASRPPLPIGNAADMAVRGWQAQLLRPVQITLDGIAKGLAADLAARALRDAGIAAGWINAGGDLLAFGATSISVHRRELNGALTPLGPLHQGAIASSAVTPQPDPRFPGHIIAGEGLTPAAGVWSVRAASAWRADALTKVAALAPPRERATLIARLGGRLLEPVLECAA